MPIKKIITASAGTGKTYRLSLEFLGLVYKYKNNPDFRYDQILVITFTRKATTEIRERIYRHLLHLGRKEDEWQELAINLKELVLNQPVSDRENPLSEKESKLFLDAWTYLSSHRDELQVMTIDSYIHNVFRNLVRPARGIDRFEVDNDAVRKRIPHLFNELMSPALKDKVKSLLARHMRPSLDEFTLFFINLVENRWLHYLATNSKTSAESGSLAFYANNRELWQEKEQEYKSAFLETFKELTDSFCAYNEASGKSLDRDTVIAEKLLLTDFHSLFTRLPDNFRQLPEIVEASLRDDYYARDLFNVLADKENFWNGNKYKGDKVKPITDNWKELYKTACTHLANYLVFRLFLPEQDEILNLWSAVLEQYDKLVFRNKSFTYNDIAWLTYEGLHTEHPPLFKAETKAQPNEFYEFISHRTRFILIDEFQDTSILQFRIFEPIIEELLSGYGILPYGGLIVVGDEKQSIFGWRGGQRDLLLNLEHLIQPAMPAEHASLISSWRSTPLLMEVINGTFRNQFLQGHLRTLGQNWKYEVDVKGLNHAQESSSCLCFRLQNLSGPGTGAGSIGKVRDFVHDMIIPFWENKEGKGTVAVLARTNNELDAIRYLLGEAGIPCEYQSSKSLLEHSVIKSILFLLRFAAYHDWYDLLAFLRSDLVLLDGSQLRKVIDIVSENTKLSIKERSEPDFSSIPKAKATYELALSLNPKSVWQSCLKIVQTCSVQTRMTQQRDFINVQKFLDVALEYEQNCRSELPELQGFLRYCEDNRKQDFLQQQDLESTSAIQLLTVHKSKGLEFDTVFIWWNLSGHKGRDVLNLLSWVQYGDPGFSCFSNYAFTLHYGKILEHSSFSSIRQEDEMRGQLEELNSLYVALTRARTRLFLNAAYQNAKGWTEYFVTNGPVGTPSFPHFVINAVNQFMTDIAEPLPDGSLLLQSKAEAHPIPSVGKDRDKIVYYDKIDIRDVISDLHTPVAEPLPDYRPGLDWKQNFLEERSNLKGNIAHYWLAQLKYATREELEEARTLTLRQFGNLMTHSALTEIITSLEQQLPKLKDLFSPDYDIIFNEYRVFHQGREYRLDRLMLNTKEKTYRIVDYKTGEISNPAQLEMYKGIIKEIFPSDYTCEPESRYIDIKILSDT